MQQFHIDKALSEDQRESKLPAWAREKLTDMRRATTESVAQLSALKAGTERGPFWLEAWDDNARYYLPANAGRLMFGVPGGRSRLSLSPGDNCYWLNISSNGCEIMAAPQAANALRICASEDR